MLVEFSFSNFRSFKDEAIFSMEPDSQNGDSYNIIDTKLKRIPQLYRSSGIFGANASGKSNIIKAFLFLQFMITNSSKSIIDDVFADLGTLSMIYPADIESFTILKDASETAQYGARGASGVIKVSTKQGSSGSFRFSYDGNYGVQAIYKTLDMLSGDAFRQVARERGISILDKGYQTDFTDEITRMGWIQNHHIAFGGGSESAYYRASLGL